MTITAQVIADSISSKGARLTTLQLRYPRFIHTEFMTHRMFSRNASSSRAIPVKRLIEDVLRDTAMPMYWGKNQPGMQAREEHNAAVQIYDPIYQTSDPHTREETWLEARDKAIGIAQAFSDAGYHKQIVNRLLEPFSYINVVVTSTEWENFFILRCHKDAQPEMQELAAKMFDVLMFSDPVERELHLPYVMEIERHQLTTSTKKWMMVSAARCARVSYLTHEMKAPDFGADYTLALKLAEDPPHMSPFEHQAKASVLPREMYFNLRGWCSQRYQMEVIAPLGDRSRGLADPKN